MALKKINYNGSSKVILRLCEMVNQLIDGGGGGGSTVTYTQTLQSGTKTGSISIDGVSTDMYAPTQPTKLSDLQNDTNFIDNTVNNLVNYYKKTETYTQAEVDALISAIVTLNILVVQTLPTQDISTTTIYLVPKQTPETQDIYDEYIYVNNAWEHIGTTEIDLSNYYTKTQTDNLLADKVDKVTGKQLSTEDFTSALKTKLDGIASGAEVNVQSDWSQSDNTADDFIKNKPTNVSDFNNDSGFITGVDVEDIGDVDLNNLANGQVLKYNSTTHKWENQNESGGGSSYTEGDGIDISAQNVISVDTTFSEASTRTNIASGDTFATILGKIKKFFTDLKTVAFTGEYADLNGLPTIPTDYVSKANGGTFRNDVTVNRTDNQTYFSIGGDKRGILRLFGNNPQYKANIYNSSNAPLTADRTFYIPDKSGTLALTSDIPDISTKVNKSGDTMTGDLTTETSFFQLDKNGTTKCAVKPIKSNFKTGITNGYWAYLFQFQYSSYNMLTLKCLFYHGFGGVDEVLIRLRFTTSGFVASSSFIVTDVDYKDMVRVSQSDVNIATIWIQGHGPSSRFGYEIIAVSDESNVFYDGEKFNSSRCYFWPTITPQSTAPSDDVPRYENITTKNISSYVSSSSKKFKENIQPLLDSEAKKILNLQAVTFDFKKEKYDLTSRKGYKNIGCIAEDVNEIIPELVTEDKNGDIYGINYIEIIPYLIKMVQLQQKQIDNLMAEISALKGE